MVASSSYSCWGEFWCEHNVSTDSSEHMKGQCTKKSSHTVSSITGCSIGRGKAECHDVLVKSNNSSRDKSGCNPCWCCRDLHLKEAAGPQHTKGEEHHKVQPSLHRIVKDHHIPPRTRRHSLPIFDCFAFVSMVSNSSNIKRNDWLNKRFRF